MDDGKIIQGLLIFAAGALLGGVSVFYYVKDKFANEKDEEIKAMELYYEDKLKSAHNDGYKKAVTEQKIATLKTYNDIVENQGYNVEKEEEMAGKEHPVEDSKSLPYEITPEEFDNPDNLHDTISCSFDSGLGVLIDDLTREEIDISEVGKENLELFASRNSDTMYIRNDISGIDFEVIKVEEDKDVYDDFEA